MTAVLVTGGAGYIGSQTCKALARAGHTPIAFDDLSQGRAAFARWGPLVRGDVLDAAALDQAFQKFRPGAALHFAGRSIASESVAEHGAYWRNNVGATVTLVDAMRRHRVPVLVFSSSASVYGTQTRQPISESAAGVPASPYGSTKLAAETVIREFGAAFGMRWIALRYFNAAGADSDGEVGEVHDPETHVIPLAIRAVRGGPPFRVFGTDYPTADGTAIRDYVHVEDLADAHVAALEVLLNGGGNGAINLGAGRGHSVRQVLAAVAATAGAAVPADDADRRPGDPPQLVADIALAARRLRWRPARSSIGDIVRTAWAWHAASGETQSRA